VLKKNTLVDPEFLLSLMTLPEKRPICETHQDQVVTSRKRDCQACWTELEYIAGHYSHGATIIQDMLKLKGATKTDKKLPKG